MSTVTIDFRVDDGWIQRMRERYRLFHTTTDFGHVLFMAEVLFQVDQTTLLNWIGTPLYWIASEGLRSIEALNTQEHSGFDMRGTSYTIIFSRRDDYVIVTEELEDVSVSVLYETLLSAWKAFADRVREFLITEFPDVVSHPGVGAWFRGEDL